MEVLFAGILCFISLSKICTITINKKLTMSKEIMLFQGNIQVVKKRIFKTGKERLTK